MFSNAGMDSPWEWANGSTTPSWGDTPSANSNAPAKENKEFLFKRALTSGIDAKKIRLRIKGTNVAADGAGCGTNSMLVYWAFFWEDENRDDSDGPSASTVDPEDEH
jgi:hypothetical protein